MSKLGTFLAVVIAFAAGATSSYWLTQQTSNDSSAAPAPSLEYQPKDIIVETAPVSVKRTTVSAIPTLEEVANTAGEFEQTVGLYRLLADKTAEELVALIDQSHRYMTGTDYRAATSIMFSRLAELDPETAISKALTARNTVVTSWIAAIFQSLARQDYNYAVAAAVELPGNLRQIAGQSILRNSNLSLAQQELAQSELGVQPPITLSGRDPRVVWEEVLNIPDRNRRLQTLSGLIRSIAAADPELALSLAQGVEDKQYRQSFVQQAIGAWAVADGNAAVNWLLANAETSDNRLLQTVFQGFATSDLEGARLALQSLDETAQQTAAAAILPVWLQRDPESAIEWARSQPPEAINQRLSSTIIATLAQQDPDLAFDWLETLPENQTRQAASMLVGVLGNSDPKGLARRIELTRNPEQQQQLAVQLVATWANNAPDDAAQWLQQQSFEDSPALYQNLIQSWTQRDAEAATQFARSLRRTEEKDAAMQGIINGSYGRNLDAAIAAFQEIEQDNVKKQTAPTLYYFLRESRPEAAEQFAKDNEIDTSAFPSLR